MSVGQDTYLHRLRRVEAALMCRTCWYQEGCPDLDTPQIREAGRRVAGMFDEYGSVVGAWHAFAEDWNVEYLPDRDSVDPSDVDLLDTLAAMSEYERGAVLAFAEGWLPRCEWATGERRCLEQVGHDGKHVVFASLDAPIRDGVEWVDDG